MKTEEILEVLRERILRSVNPEEDTDEEEIRHLIEKELSNARYEFMLSVKTRRLCARRLFDEMKRLDLLQDYLEDESITEIMVNGSGSPIYIEKQGKLYATERAFPSPERLVQVAQRIVASTNKIVNEMNPIVDTRLPDGSRVNIVLAPALLGGGAAITIRKFSRDPIDIGQMIASGTITAEAADFLRDLVRAGYNIFISGGTGSGKTTFLNALSAFIPKDERIITIEDSAELQLKQVKNLVRLEARDKNLEGRGEIRIADLIKTALRMRPDRIIVGEVRGPEAIDMLQAMQTGHDGSLSTGHANDPMDMCLRLETMIISGTDIPLAAIRRQIASGIDIMVHLERMHDGCRRVVSINEVVGLEDDRIKIRSLYEYNSVDGEPPRLHRTEHELVHRDKLRKMAADFGLCS